MKCTPEPWKVEECNVDYGKPKFEINFSRKEFPIAGVGVPAESEEIAKNNAHLIVDAVNACFKINPDNPYAVVEVITDMYEILKELAAYAHIVMTMLSASNIAVDFPTQLTIDCLKERYDKAQKILAEAKKTEEEDVTS